MLLSKNIRALIAVLFLMVAGLLAFSPVPARTEITAPQQKAGGELPQAPSNISANTIPGRPLELKVSWSPVENAEGYIVWIRRDVADPSSTWDRLEVLTKSATSLIEDNIDPGKKYGFKVQAFNGKGTGPFSDVAIVQSLSQ